MGHDANRAPQPAQPADLARRRWDQQQPRLHRSVHAVPAVRDTKLPAGHTNWGHFSNARFDDLTTRAQASFDPEEQMKLLAEAHAILVDEAAWLYICHDPNPRAMTKSVQNFHPAQSWSQDFTQITMG